MKVKGLGIRYHKKKIDQQQGAHVDHMCVEHGEVVVVEVEFVIVVVDTGHSHMDGRTDGTDGWTDGRDVRTVRVIATIL